MLGASFFKIGFNSKEAKQLLFGIQLKGGRKRRGIKYSRIHLKIRLPVHIDLKTIYIAGQSKEICRRRIPQESSYTGKEAIGKDLLT